MRAAWLVGLAACWTAPPPEPPTPPRPVAAGAPHWKRDKPALRPPFELSKQLTQELRTAGTDLLPGEVDGPVVLLDLDAGTFHTLCGVDAVRAAQAWGLFLVDPARPSPSCMLANEHFVCRQFGPGNQPFLMLELLHDDAGFRLLSAIAGTTSSPQITGSYRKISELKAHVDGATCP